MGGRLGGDVLYPLQQWPIREAPLKRGTFSSVRVYGKGRNLGREVCQFGL